MRWGRLDQRGADGLGGLLAAGDAQQDQVAEQIKLGIFAVIRVLVA